MSSFSVMWRIRRARIQDADLAALLRDEPDPALEVGKRRADPLVVGEHAGQVVVADLGDAPPVGRHLEHEDVAGLRRAPDAVATVEEEVAAAGEVLVRLGTGRVGGVRHVVRGEHVERGRVDHPGLRRQADRRADADQIALAVEGERAAQRGSHQAGERGRARAQRPGPAVGIGHPGVVVDVAPRVSGQVRVLRGDAGAHRLRGRGSALVPRKRRGQRIGDRDRSTRRRRGTEQDDEGQDSATHRATVPRPAPRSRRYREPGLYCAARADVAQLARASACHAEGRGFESLHPLLAKAPLPAGFSRSWRLVGADCPGRADQPGGPICSETRSAGGGTLRVSVRFTTYGL
jgi:hypothetical protein